MLPERGNLPLLAPPTAAMAVLPSMSERAEHYDMQSHSQRRNRVQGFFARLRTPRRFAIDIALTSSSLLLVSAAMAQPNKVSQPVSTLVTFRAVLVESELTTKP